MDFPLILPNHMGDIAEFLVYLFIGIAFGAVLELSGFGNSKKLAAQFYFKEMTVLKVMFSAIVVAMLGVFMTSALGWLDYEMVWVNPTFLVPGIVGGFVMGVGFVVGGFCPGTSLVSAATLKLDGIVFVMGVIIGIFAFGETVSTFDDFWHSTDEGRYTLQELFDVDAGVVVIGVVVLALVLFGLAEWIERRMKATITPITFPKWRYAAAGAGIALALAVVVMGQPVKEEPQAVTLNAEEANIALQTREVYLHPAEVLHVMTTEGFVTRIIDVRSAEDYATFHLKGAENLPIEQLPEHLEELKAITTNTAIIICSNDEAAATNMWSAMVEATVPNIYILEGGLNNWLATFGDESFLADHPALDDAKAGQLGYAFAAPVGADCSAADPDPTAFGNLNYTAKIKVEPKAVAPAGGGGCG